jgi:hypothetical protein
LEGFVDVSAGAPIGRSNAMQSIRNTSRCTTLAAAHQPLAFLGVRMFMLPSVLNWETNSANPGLGINTKATLHLYQNYLIYLCNKFTNELGKLCVMI